MSPVKLFTFSFLYLGLWFCFGIETTKAQDPLGHLILVTGFILAVLSFILGRFQKP